MKQILREHSVAAILVLLTQFPSNYRTVSSSGGLTASLKVVQSLQTKESVSPLHWIIALLAAVS